MSNFFFNTGELDKKYLEFGSVPTNKNSPGISGQIAFDYTNFYICTSGDGITGQWKIVRLAGDWRK